MDSHIHLSLANHEWCVTNSECLLMRSVESVQGPPDMMTCKHAESSQAVSEMDAIKPRLKEEIINYQIDSNSTNLMDVNDLPNLSRELRELFVLLFKTAKTKLETEKTRVCEQIDSDARSKNNEKRTDRVPISSKIDEIRNSKGVNSKKETNEGLLCTSVLNSEATDKTKVKSGSLSQTSSGKNVKIHDQQKKTFVKMAEPRGSLDNTNSEKESIANLPVQKSGQANDGDCGSQYSQDMECDSDIEIILEETSHKKTTDKLPQPNVNEKFVSLNSPEQDLFVDQRPTHVVHRVRFALDTKPSPPR
ncbi:8704_t:CDS:2 [Acaulospora morrowiae]|uniref:8704_t:CDS:1 n=1 Tax=Acaulospora morrowiae TaxID=94023 RepID=A0A9N9C1V9_9GLOM|nr:8704_t:CDS:2 [Acaulospora morrowiae]